jgi:hypothetical protein
MLTNSRSTHYLLAAILVGLCADRLFFDKRLGISLLLFVLLFSGVLIFLGWRSGVPVARRNLWLFAPLLFFAAMVAIRDNAFVTALNVLAVAGLLAYLLLYYAAGRVGEFGLLTATILPVYAAAKSFVGAPPIMTEAIDTPRVLQGGRGNLVPVARGGLLAVPLLIIFTLLLASADLIFANQVAGLFKLLNIATLFRLNMHGLFIIGIAWAAAGGLALALNRKDDAAALDRQVTRLRRFRFLGATESTTLLILIDLLFLSFVAIQFRYLFGGQININLAGFTYAEYARRGFFELLIVAILSLGLILGLEAVTNRESKRQFKVFNLLSSLMIVLVIIMLVSAFRRMQLYEATFGYTELRLYVYAFMIWLGLFLTWFILGLWRRPDRFALGALLIVMGFVVSLNLINPDAFIVRQNMARYWHGGDLDVVYLESLSAGAVPALIEALAEGDKAGKTVTVPCQAHLPNHDAGEMCELDPIELVRDGLQNRYQKMQDDDRWRSWQSAHLSRYRAHRLQTRQSTRAMVRLARPRHAVRMALYQIMVHRCLQRHSNGRDFVDQDLVSLSFRDLPRCQENPPSYWRSRRSCRPPPVPDWA